MKSYLSAFGKALIVTSLPRYSIHRSMDRKFFSENSRYCKNTSSPAKINIQFLNLSIFSPRRFGMPSFSTLNAAMFTLAKPNVFYYCNEKAVSCSGPRAMDDRITIADLWKAKQEHRRIAAVSCYDYTTARLVSQVPVEVILVGDSAAQSMLGFDSTLPATMDFMVAITAAVRRGAPNVYLIADMPFLSYQVSIPEAIRNAGRFVTEAGAQMVKIEATAAHLNTIRAVVDAGIAVMAHIGIRPQSINMMGRFRAEATTAEMAIELIGLARRMVEAGTNALLIEGTAAEVAQLITEQSDVPVISCGSGAGCDGQILIAPDILGLSQNRLPKFAKAYGELGAAAVEALRMYAEETKAGRFPDADHSYHMKPGELQRLRDLSQTDH